MKILSTIGTEDFPHGAEGELIPLESLPEEARRAILPGYVPITYGGKMFALPWFRVRACDDEAMKVQRAAAYLWDTVYGTD